MRRLAWAGVVVLLLASITGLIVQRELGRRPFLALELIDMKRDDGSLRRQLPPVRIGQRLPPVLTELLEEIGRMDRRNTERLKEIVAEYGWPGRTLVGRRGSSAAWLLVQHARHDRAFQRRALGLMQDAGPDEVDPRDVAYLTDDLLVGENQPQEYGTKFSCRNGELVLVGRVRDRAHVDQRRARAGLETLEENRRRLIRRDGPCPP